MKTFLRNSDRNSFKGKKSKDEDESGIKKMSIKFLARGKKPFIDETDVDDNVEEAVNEKNKSDLPHEMIEAEKEKETHNDGENYDESGEEVETYEVEEILDFMFCNEDQVKI